MPKVPFLSRRSRFPKWSNSSTQERIQLHPSSPVIMSFFFDSISDCCISFASWFIRIRLVSKSSLFSQMLSSYTTQLSLYTASTELSLCHVPPTSHHGGFQFSCCTRQKHQLDMNKSLLNKLKPRATLPRRSPTTKPHSKTHHCDSKRHDTEETGGWLKTSMASRVNHTQLNNADTTRIPEANTN